MKDLFEKDNNYDKCSSFYVPGTLQTFNTYLDSFNSVLIRFFQDAEKRSLGSINVGLLKRMWYREVEKTDEVLIVRLLEN